MSEHHHAGSTLSTTSGKFRFNPMTREGLPHVFVIVTMAYGSEGVALPLDEARAMIRCLEETVGRAEKLARELVGA